MTLLYNNFRSLLGNGVSSVFLTKFLHLELEICDIEKSLGEIR